MRTGLWDARGWQDEGSVCTGWGLSGLSGQLDLWASGAKEQKLYYFTFVMELL